jgi:DNA-binding NtrC family response regulator
MLAATNRNLQNGLSSSRFRSHLYYRLNEVSTRIPSLREHREDVQLLIAQAISTLAQELQMIFVPEVAADYMAEL